MKKKYLILGMCILFAGILWLIVTPLPRGELLTTKAYPWQDSSLKVDVYEQLLWGSPALSGVYYVFEFRSDESSDWVEIFQMQSDDLLEVDEYGIKIMNKDIAYIYFSSRYAVTTNHGDSWDFWKSKEKGYIDSVNIDENGAGTLRHLRYGNGWTTNEYMSNDYGVHWRNEESPK
jgi:hypothetical protein